MIKTEAQAGEKDDPDDLGSRVKAMKPGLFIEVEIEIHKSQSPNYKHQIITNHQIPMTQNRSFGYWLLEFIWLLMLGVWIFF
jgi:hypothetical protein